jgi:hypothetical protein
VSLAVGMLAGRHALRTLRTADVEVREMERARRFLLSEWRELKLVPKVRLLETDHPFGSQLIVQP